MMQGNLSELELWGVYDPGLPNLERIVLRVAEHVDMASFALIIGRDLPGGNSLPLQDNFFWFGNAFLNPGDWVFIYTGAGTPAFEQLAENSQNKIYTLYWNRKQTIFHMPYIRPVLIRMDAIRNKVHNPTQELGQGAAKPMLGQWSGAAEA
jgi:hypothetical protein